MFANSWQELMEMTDVPLPLDKEDPSNEFPTEDVVELLLEEYGANAVTVTVPSGFISALWVCP